jgi:hypothetical protein
MRIADCFGKICVCSRQGHSGSLCARLVAYSEKCRPLSRNALWEAWNEHRRAAAPGDRRSCKLGRPADLFPDNAAERRLTQCKRTSHSTRRIYAATLMVKRMSRSVRAGPPAPDFAASSRRACVPPFLRLDLIFREPYLAEAVTSLNVGIQGHHYSYGPQVTA